MRVNIDLVFLLKMLLHNLERVLGGVLKGQLLDQMTTLGQRPIVTSVSAPCSLRTFTYGRSHGMKEITRMMRSMIRHGVISKGSVKGEAQMMACLLQKQEKGSLRKA